MAYDAIQGSLDVSLPRHQKPSFLAVGYMVLLGDTVRGIFFPTLWPLVSSFGGTRSAQGVIVAAFSMGRMVASGVEAVLDLRSTETTDTGRVALLWRL